MTEIYYELLCYVDGALRLILRLHDGINGPRRAEKVIAEFGANTKRRKRHGIPVFKSGRVKFRLRRVETDECGAGYTWDASAGMMRYSSDVSLTED